MAMAEKRLCGLRMGLKATRLPPLRQTFSSDAPKTSHTPEDEVAFLRAQDQKALSETKQRIDAMLAQLDKITQEIGALPTMAGKSPGMSPAYTLGAMRQRFYDTPRIVSHVRSRLTHVKDHLDDLQHEPYPERKSKDVAEWENKIQQMSRPEREDLLQSMQLQEAADLARLKRDSEGLVRQVEDMRAMGRSADGAPRAASRVRGGRAKAVASAQARSGKGSDTTTARAAAAAASSSSSTDASTSLADLQRQLEAGIYGGRT